MKKNFTILAIFLNLFASPILFSDEALPSSTEAFIEAYPELHWLADNQVRKTEEGVASGEGYSLQLFGQAYPEFDRSLLSIQCLEWILDGSDASYQSFTASQPISVRLTPAHFQELHERGLSILNNTFGLTPEETHRALQAALILGDMGKSPKARELFKPFGVSAPDQDDFYQEAMELLKTNPNLSPTFSVLPPAAQDLLTSTAHMVHYGHITHLEGGSAMFHQIKARNTDHFALEFDLFVHLCDVSGALAHVKPGSSFVYTEQTHKAMDAMRQSCLALLDPEFTEQDAYNQYVSQRATWLGFNAKNPLDRCLARVGAMLRLFTPEEGTILKEAIASLPEKERQKIIAQLDVEGMRINERTPTYMPAVLVNLSNNPSLGDTPEKRLRQAVILGLPFISRTLEAYRKELKCGMISSHIPICFNPAARIAKAAPGDLAKAKIAFDHEGNVILK